MFHINVIESKWREILGSLKNKFTKNTAPSETLDTEVVCG